MSTYEEHILSILREANQETGLSLNTIVHNVINMTSRDIFESRNIEDVRKDVVKYLRRESSKKGGAVVKSLKRGYYRLNGNAKQTQQLTLEFEKELNNVIIEN